MIKEKLLNFLSRALRLIAATAILYFCMIFYLMLTEREHAFPRAITHDEAVAAISSKAVPKNCTLPDGLVLHGWTLGSNTKPALFYFPMAHEDAAQFLAENQKLSESIQLIAFNYRGSGENKGRPTGKTFESDAGGLLECAEQITPDLVLSGRGVGAILATNLKKKGQKSILIDPIPSIAARISGKYKKLYPEFLVRTKLSISKTKLWEGTKDTRILLDRSEQKNQALRVYRINKNISLFERHGNTLSNALNHVLLSFHFPTENTSK